MSTSAGIDNHLQRKLSRRVKSYNASSNAEASIIRDQFSWRGKHVTHGGEGVLYLMHSLASGYWLSSLVSPRGRAIPWYPLVIYIIYSSIIVFPMEVGKFYNQDSVWIGLGQGISYTSTALFFLLTFRVNSAYLRWTRGRQLWSNMASYVLGISRIVTAKMLDSRKLARRITRWNISYIICLKRGLRKEDRIVSELEGILIPFELEALKAEAVEDRAHYCLTKITHAWGESQRGKLLMDAGSKELEKIVPYMNQDQHSMTALANTPMPWAYVSHLRVMLVIWLGALPFLFVASMGYYAILPCFFIGLVILGMDGMALEIEWPYGRKWNDLPIENWCEECVVKLIRHYAATSDLPNADGSDEGEADELRLNWDKMMEEEEEMLASEQEVPALSLVKSFFVARQPKSESFVKHGPGNGNGESSLRSSHQEAKQAMERINEVKSGEDLYPLDPAVQVKIL